MNKHLQELEKQITIDAHNEKLSTMERALIAEVYFNYEFLQEDDETEDNKKLSYEDIKEIACNVLNSGRFYFELKDIINNEICKQLDNK